MCLKKIKIEKNSLFKDFEKFPAFLILYHPVCIFYLDIRIRAISYHMNRATGPIIITSGRRTGTRNLISEYLTT